MQMIGGWGAAKPPRCRSCCLRCHPLCPDTPRHGLTPLAALLARRWDFVVRTWANLGAEARRVWVLEGATEYMRAYGLVQVRAGWRRRT